MIAKKKLLLILERDDDPGTNTTCFYWVKCPKNNELDMFKDTVRKCVSELIYDGAYVLRERANLRRGFNKQLK